MNPSNASAITRAGAELHGLQLPQPIGLWPLAPGWWILIALVMIALLALSFGIYRYRKQRFRRQARFLAKHKWQQLAASATGEILSGAQWLDFIQQQNRLLKRYCQHACPQAISLNGQAWVDFLTAASSQTLFSTSQQQWLAAGIYQPLPEKQTLSEAKAFWHSCDRWLSSANPALNRQISNDSDANTTKENR